MSPTKTPSRPRTARVKESFRLTPQMIRVVFHGADLLDLPVGDFTDAYVKLLFPPADAPYRTAEEYSALREGLESQHRPALRTYTIRAYDPVAGELTLDFVHHGEE